MAQLAVPDKDGGVHLARKLTLGSELSCTTIHGNIFRGNLMAQDDEARLIALKETPSESPNFSVHIVNLANTPRLEVVNEPLKAPDSYIRLPQVDMDKVRRRRESNVAAKWKEAKSRGVNVTDQAQQLFNYISKMYNDIEWDKDVIVVLKDVRISPPYDPENCEGSQSACDRIMKQVAKFHKELGP